MVLNLPVEKDKFFELQRGEVDFNTRKIQNPYISRFLEITRINHDTFDEKFTKDKLVHHLLTSESEIEFPIIFLGALIEIKEFSHAKMCRGYYASRDNIEFELDSIIVGKIDEDQEFNEFIINLGKVIKINN